VIPLEEPGNLRLCAGNDKDICRDEDRVLKIAIVFGMNRRGPSASSESWWEKRRRSERHQLSV
jgi:hypothetical protein